MSKPTLCRILMVVLVVASRASAAEHTTDTVEVVKKNLQDKKAILLDVREQSEWDAGHLDGAKLLPLSQLKQGVDAKKVAEVLPKDRIVYCHCAGGRRVLPAADVLKQLGYDVRPLKLGYQALLDAGFTPAKK